PRRRAAEGDPGRDNEALVAPVIIGPGDRLSPLLFQIRPAGSVVERLVLLSPVALEPQPWVLLQVSRLGRRDECDYGPNLEGGAARVVASNSLRSASAEMEVRSEVVGVRAERGIDDGMSSADDRQLGVSPASAFGSVVLAEADQDRLRRQRLSRCGGVEVELDHLPVAFVLVVEVVEDVEEPVLKRERVGILRLLDDAGVRGRRMSL